MLTELLWHREVLRRWGLLSKHLLRISNRDGCTKSSEEQGAAALRILAGHARRGSGADRGRAKGCRRREEQRSHGELHGRRRHEIRERRGPSRLARDEKHADA